MHAAGAAGAVVVLADCTSVAAIPGYGIACTPEICPPYEQDGGADSPSSADAPVDSPEASAEDAREADVTDASTSDATAEDASSDAPDGD
jgi:hypothetical protein